MKRAIIFLIFSMILFSVSGCGNSGNNGTDYTNFAKCLTEKGVAMYGTERCPHCIEQKALFGQAFKFVKYVDCDYEYDKCIEKGVKYTPTWDINGTNVTGLQSIEKLSQLSGCPIQ